MMNSSPMIRLLLRIVMSGSCAVVVGCVHNGPAQMCDVQPAPGEKVLYHKALSGSRELFVIQTPLVPVAAVDGFVDPSRGIRDIVGAFNQAMEIRSALYPPIQLWSRTIIVYQKSECDEFEVLDVMILPKRIIMVMANSYSFIDIMTIRLPDPCVDVELPYREWSGLANLIPNTPGTHGAKLAYDEKKQRIDVEIIESLEGNRLHTSFEQKDDKWEFSPVKRWHDTVPTTRP